MTDERNMTDADIEALKNALVDDLVVAIEKKLAERFYANAGKGMIGWVIKLWQPILIALILYGLTIAPKLPVVIAGALQSGTK